MDSFIFSLTFPLFFPPTLSVCLIQQLSLQLKDGLWHVDQFQSQSAPCSESVISRHHTIIHVKKKKKEWTVSQTQQKQRAVQLSGFCSTSEFLRLRTTHVWLVHLDERKHLNVIFFLWVFKAELIINIKKNPNNTIKCWKVWRICIQFCVICCCALSLFTCPEQWSVFPQMMMSHLEGSCSSCAALRGAALFISSIMWKIYLLTHKWVTFFLSTQD